MRDRLAAVGVSGNREECFQFYGQRKYHDGVEMLLKGGGVRISSANAEVDQKSRNDGKKEKQNIRVATLC